MIPTGRYLRISSRDAVQGRTTEKTFSSRMRRAMSCVYCEPKSRMTIDCSSTNNFARFARVCKAPSSEKSRRLLRSPWRTGVARLRRFVGDRDHQIRGKAGDVEEIGDSKIH